MRTLVYPPSGVLGIGRSRTVGVIAKPLTAAEARAIAIDLTDNGIQVAATVDEHRTVHLWAGLAVTTPDEAVALHAYFDRTDARVVWHKAVKS